MEQLHRWMTNQGWTRSHSYYPYFAGSTAAKRQGQSRLFRETGEQDTKLCTESSADHRQWTKRMKIIFLDYEVAVRTHMDISRLLNRHQAQAPLCAQKPANSWHLRGRWNCPWNGRPAWLSPLAQFSTLTKRDSAYVVVDSERYSLR